MTLVMLVAALQTSCWPQWWVVFSVTIAKQCPISFFAKCSELSPSGTFMYRSYFSTKRWHNTTPLQHDLSMTISCSFHPAISHRHRLPITNKIVIWDIKATLTWLYNSASVVQLNELTFVRTLYSAVLWKNIRNMKNPTWTGHDGCCTLCS